MRLSERESFYRQKNHVVTMEDVRRQHHAEAVAERKERDRQRQAAKGATKGPALLEVADGD